MTIEIAINGRKLVFTGRALWVVTIWLTLNVAMNLYNKWIFTIYGFQFPFFITMTHMVIGFIGSLCLIYIPFLRNRVFSSQDRVKVLQRPTRGTLLKVILLAVFAAANTGLNNASLVYINISTNQVVRATLPVVVVLVSFVLEKKRYSKKIMGVIIAIVGSASAALYKQPEFDFWGVFLAGLSVVASGLWTVLTAILLGAHGRMNPIQLVYYTAPPIFIYLLPAFLVFELKPIGEQLPHVDPVPIVLIILMGGALAFSYNIVHYWLVIETGSVGSSVMGNIKVVLLIILSIVLFGTDLYPWNVAGTPHHTRDVMALTDVL